MSDLFNQRFKRASFEIDCAASGGLDHYVVFLSALVKLYNILTSFPAFAALISACLVDSVEFPVSWYEVLILFCAFDIGFLWGMI